MQIQFNTDHNVEGREELAAHVTKVVEKALKNMATQVTRVEVHVSEQNGSKAGRDDMRCMMEARIKHHQPVAVTHNATTLSQAVDGAADKLGSALNKRVGRLRDGS
jgi:ribosome-associated translation inhibitor RaiA